MNLVPWAVALLKSEPAAISLPSATLEMMHHATSVRRLASQIQLRAYAVVSGPLAYGDLPSFEPVQLVPSALAHGDLPSFEPALP